MRKIEEMAQPNGKLRVGVTPKPEPMRTEVGLKNGGSPAHEGAILEEIFYISSKRSTLYRVRLTERCLSLRKESNNGPSKTEAILVDDIVGCRCMRSKRRNAGSCACRATRGAPRLVESTEPVQPHDEYDTSAYLYIYAYIMKRAHKAPDGRPRRRERMTVTLRFRSFDRYEDNLREASRWRLAIKCLIRRLPVPRPYMSPTHRNLQSLLAACPDEPKKLLVILNPKAGSGRARESFQRRVHPILAEAELTYDLFITRHPDYARDFVRARDLSQWSGLVLVGGDGIVFEAINGLLQRPDWQDCFANMPVGVIPCGSGNGLAASIAYSRQEPFDHNPMMISALAVVRRHRSKMDLVRVETRKQTLFSFLSIGWGLLADIDIESERLRAIGGQRFTVWSVARLIGLRTYRGVVSYLPCDNSEDSNGLAKSNGESITRRTPVSPRDRPGIPHSKSYGDQLDRCSSIRESRSFDGGVAGGEAMHDLDDEDELTTEALQLETETTTAAAAGAAPRRRCDSFFSATSRKSAYFSTGSASVSSTYHSVGDLDDPDSNLDSHAKSKIMYGPPSTLPALTTKVPSSWVKVEGEFIVVQAAYQSHLGQDCFFAPRAKLDDGVIWLMIVRAGISRTVLLQFLLGLSTGSHLSYPGVQMIPVRAFRIEPAEDQGSGLLTVDGERVDYGPLQAEIFSSLATVMCP